MANFEPLGPCETVTDASGRVLARTGRGLIELKPVGDGVLRVRAALGTGPLPGYTSAAVGAGEALGVPYQLKRTRGASTLTAERSERAV
jgi:hypothetical protein